MLPAVDTNPTTGVQVIDRSTVPELGQLVATASSLQSMIDSANARLNPLGLSPGAIAFDISPPSCMRVNPILNRSTSARCVPPSMPRVHSIKRHV